MTTVRYSKQHEWIRVEGDQGVIGISDHAQQQLGDIVFVDLPEVGRHVTRGDEAAVVESVKAASEVYAPVDGEIIAVNAALTDDPATVNGDAEGAGWFFRIRLSDPAQVDDLMDATAYAACIKDGG